MLGKPLVGFCWFVLNSVTIKEKRRGLRVISLRLMELVAGEGGCVWKKLGEWDSKCLVKEVSGDSLCLSGHHPAVGK